ncbi:hypothetical protein F5Y04DRAFT_98176 [Hypomontagnella monticulosa]|nr:hypothetical protein F5Y04DRAFT_98176 [Hypomontagnella monticulosa]
MERKHETPRGSADQDQSKDIPEIIDPHAANPQQASRDTASAVALQRPWTTRQSTLSESLRKEHWWKEKSHKKGALEYWKTQPMIDGPYQNVQSVVSKSSTDKSSDPQTPTQAAAPSETAATSGSAR